MVSWMVIIFDKLQRNSQSPPRKPFIPIGVHQLQLIYTTKKTHMSMQGNLTLPQRNKTYQDLKCYLDCGGHK